MFIDVRRKTTGMIWFFTMALSERSQGVVVMRITPASITAPSPARDIPGTLLSHQDGLNLYTCMRLTREVEQRAIILYRQG
ncbi:MAG: hypothetical protein ACE5E8_04950, partial [Acidimicrobiia bacterium]